MSAYENDTVQVGRHRGESTAEIPLIEQAESYRRPATAAAFTPQPAQQVTSSRYLDACANEFNSSAKWAIGFGICSMMFFAGILGPLAIVFGLNARKQIAANPQRGPLLALSAIVLGSLAVLQAMGDWLTIAMG